MRSLYPWPFFPINLAPPAARSLCLLFILQELLFSFELFASLQKATPKAPLSERAMKEIGQKIEKFLLFSLENPLGQKGGALDKLCFYSEVLLQASKVEEEEILLKLEEMRNLVLQLKSRLWPLKRGTFSNRSIEVLAQFYTDVRSELCAFFTSLFPFLLEARSDENVLLSLIEKKERLNLFLGPRAVEELLHRLFPAGLAQLRAILCEGFTRRGFASFFAEKEALVDELEWEAPCHLLPQMH